MARAILAREEWDFSSCPEAHLEACYYYEFARESDKAKSKELAYRSAIESAQDEDESRLRGIYTFHQYCPEFPETPFLGIPKQKQTERIAAVWKMPALTQANLSAIIRTHETDFSQAKTLPYFSGFGEGAIAAFYINWGVPLPRLVEGFRHWLEQNKPPYANLAAKNGAGSTLRQMRKRLKTLGAVRLLRIFDWHDAFKHSECRLKDRDARPRGLYSDEQAGWIRAKKEGEKAIENVCRLIESLL